MNSPSPLHASRDGAWKPLITRFLTAQTISLLGSSLVQYAIIWYITLSTSSGKMLAISTVCGFAPQIIISLFAGVWVDRHNRKTMIMLADGAIALFTLAAALAFAFGYRSPVLLFAVMAVRSAGTGIQTPAVNAILPQIVPKSSLMKVNGILSTLNSVIMVLSPALSGLILVFAPLQATLMIDVLTAVIGIGITAAIPIAPHTPDAPKAKTSDNLKEGFRYLRSNRPITAILYYQLATFFLISPAAFLMPLMVSRSFGPEIWRLCAGEMCYSIGAVLGGVLITSWGGFRSRVATSLLAGALYGVLMIGLGISPSFFLYLGLTLMIGLVAPCYSAPLTVLIQETVPPSFHGRVFSFMQISTGAALPMGMLVFGPMADHVPIQTLMAANGVLVALWAAYAAFSKSFFRSLI